MTWVLIDHMFLRTLPQESKDDIQTVGHSFVIPALSRRYVAVIIIIKTYIIYHLHMYPYNHGDLMCFCVYVYINNLVYTHEPGTNDQLQ